ILSLCLLTMASGASQAEPLDVKPGLWETTTVVEKRRAKQPTNLDQLTPEQRIKVEAKLAKQVKRETRTFTACLSEASIKSGEAFTGNTHRGACDHEFETQTARNLATTIECRGANKMTGTVEMHAADSEHMSGVVKMIYGPSERMQLLTRSEINSRWIQSSCETLVGVGPSGNAVH
ncbi:MAG: DUF3617 family protein, partial [Candidatus Thiodiazotropha sp.]